MTATQEIFEGQDFYAPTFEVRQQDKGRALPNNIVRDITQVEYHDHVEQIDTYQLILNNWDADKRAYKYSDGAQFVPGMQLELWMGYYGRNPLRRMISGPITSVRPSFPASGQPTITVEGQNLLHTLQGEKLTKPYRNRTDSEIAKEIGERLEIRVRTDPSAERDEERREYVLQTADVPTIVFLLKWARRIGYDLYVGEEGGERFLYFGPSVGVRGVSYRLSYGRSLIHFDPDLNTTDQVESVEYYGWDNRNKRPIRHTANRRDLRVRGLKNDAAQETIEKSFRNVKELITHLPVETPQEARTIATETLERNAKEMIRGTGSTVGLPSLVAGSVIHIDGVGTRFSGRYFVTSTTHAINDGGYTTQFHCRREEV